MKEIKYGGGVRTCQECGELINGSIIHRCKKEDKYKEFLNETSTITEEDKQPIIDDFLKQYKKSLETKLKL